VISIRYSIPLLIVLFTAGLAAYTVQRDWSSAEAVVRGEAVAHMMNRMTMLQKQVSEIFSRGKSEQVTEELALLRGAAEPQFAALADDNAKVMISTSKTWVGQTLYQKAGSEWQSWLGESLQNIVDRVKDQNGGEVLVLGEGRYVLGVYPVALAEPDSKVRNSRTGVLLVQRDLSHDLARARRSIKEQTLETVYLLVMMAVIVGILVHFFLTKRLNQLVGLTDRFAGGDFLARANLRGKDEVAKLGAAFNRMATQVGDSQRELESRVLARTAELANTVRELQSEIYERRKIERALFNEKERIQITLASIGDAVITTDVNGSIDYLNPIAEKLAGRPGYLAIGLGFPEVFRIFDEKTRDPANDPVQQCLSERKLVKLGNTVLLIGKDEKERSLDISAAPIKERDGTLIGVVLICRDVTEMHRIARQLSYQASHDSMTGLINRREFERRLQRVLDTAKSDEAHALLYLDLDQFKIVNDSCGHFAGDELLRQVSSVLTQSVRKRDTLARLGGDEFGVLLEHCHPDQAILMANQMRLAIQDFCFLWEDRSFRVGASIGLVPIKAGIDTLASVFRTADSACYAAKELGRNRVHVYQTGDLELAQRHGEMQWIPRIQEALAQNNFTLFVQPIFPVDTKFSLHYEVLLRMVNRDGELMLPSVFIPVAERYNQMQAIDRWVVRHAFEALKNPDIVPGNIGLAINLSGQSLSDPQFLEFVERQIINKQIDLTRICFEITETAAIGNLMHARRFFSALRPRGCRFALDDFGSGLSSFAYLKSLPIDYLKIDGAFVKDMASDPIDYAMVEAIHRIGHVMGIETIAEFVESESILSLLKIIGVNYAQGHGLANPRPLVSESQSMIILNR
jgi:diguanylate cyclase (GGDEF)-like protein/PAS domain S-box-containing protein